MLEDRVLFLAKKKGGNLVAVLLLISRLLC